jgi:hypothetical protein
MWIISVQTIPDEKMNLPQKIKYRPSCELNQWHNTMRTIWGNCSFTLNLSDFLGYLRLLFYASCCVWKNNVVSWKDNIWVYHGLKTVFVTNDNFFFLYSTTLFLHWCRTKKIYHPFYERKLIYFFIILVFIIYCKQNTR